jgi:hypothetical protein
VDISKGLEKVGRVIVGGAGDQVIVGIILGLIEDVTPGTLYSCIKENIDFSERISELNWSRAKRITGQMNLDDITTERIEAELRANRLDLLSIIINTHGGEAWLNNQLEKMKSKLRD